MNLLTKIKESWDELSKKAGEAERDGRDEARFLLLYLMPDTELNNPETIVLLNALSQAVIRIRERRANYSFIERINFEMGYRTLAK